MLTTSHSKVRPLLAALALLLSCAAASAQTVMINELYYNSPSSDAGCFTELYGPPGTSLEGYALIGYNGNAACAEYARITFTGTQAIGADGFFVVAMDTTVPGYDIVDSMADWQNGDDSVGLEYQGSLIEQISYGNVPSSTDCVDPGCGGVYAGCPWPGESINRCPSGQPGAAYMINATSARAANPCYTPTPVTSGTPATDTPTPTVTGTPPTDTPSPTATVTPTPTNTPPISEIMINELYYNSTGSPDTQCFTEICGPAGASLDGYSLIGMNGSAGGEVYAMIELTGQVIPENGLFVVGQDNTVPNVDLIDPLADWQNGPDCVALQLAGATVDSIAYGETDPGCGRYAGWPFPESSLNRCANCSFYGDIVPAVAEQRSPGEPNPCAPTPTPTPTGIATESPTPTVTPTGPTATPTLRPTATPTNTPSGETPTATPTMPPTATPTMPCENLTLTFLAPATMIHPMDTWNLDLQICNPAAEFTLPLVVMLDVGISEYWFWPNWKHYPPEIDYKEQQTAMGLQTVPIIPAITWPDTGSSSLSFSFYAAYLNASLTALASDLGSGTFSYGP